MSNHLNTREIVEYLLIGVSIADRGLTVSLPLSCYSPLAKELAWAVRIRNPEQVRQWLNSKSCNIRDSQIVAGLIGYLREVRLREMVGELEASRGFMTTQEILARIDRIKEFANGKEVEDCPREDGSAEGGQRGTGAGPPPKPPIQS